MADSYNYGLRGVSGNVKVGNAGPRVKNNAGVIEARNTADNAFAVVRAADPVGLDDVVTKRYLETRSNVIVTGKIDGNAPPAVVVGAVYLCTTTGGTYTAGRLYYGENAVWNEVIPAEGLTISVTDALSGGTLTFLADHRYVWDADGSVWVDIGPAPAEAKLIKIARASLAFGTSSPLNVGSALPVGATVTRIIVSVTQAFNSPTATVSFGVAGQVAELGATNETDLDTTGIYIIDCYKTYVSNEQVLATYAAGGATAGAASIEIQYSLD